MISGLEADLSEQRDLTHNLVIGMVCPDSHFSLEHQMKVRRFFCFTATSDA